jgi:hypothetical protein
MRSGLEKQSHNNQRSTMKGQMIIPDGTGHSTLEWDTEMPATVYEVRSRFAAELRRGALLFATDTAGVSTQVKQFDPEAAPRITSVRQLAGGRGSH